MCRRKAFYSLCVVLFAPVSPAMTRMKPDRAESVTSRTVGDLFVTVVGESCGVDSESSLPRPFG